MSRRANQFNRKVKMQINKMMANLGAVETADLVKAIDAALIFADGSEEAARDHRLDAARMYVVLHDRIVSEGEDWWRWHKDNFARGKRDAQRLLAVGRAFDPEAAIERQRTKIRDSTAKHREASAKATYNATVCHLAAVRLVKTLERGLEKLDDKERSEFWNILREKWHGEIFAENANVDEVQGQRATAAH